jgi:hypothetical protein
MSGWCNLTLASGLCGVIVHDLIRTWCHMYQGGMSHWCHGSGMEFECTASWLSRQLESRQVDWGLLGCLAAMCIGVYRFDLKSFDVEWMGLLESNGLASCEPVSCGLTSI